MGLLNRSKKKVEEAAPTAPVPSKDTEIWVRLPCCESAVHPSRVEDIRDDKLLITVPSDPHPEPVADPEEGASFTVGWQEGTASKQVRVTYHSSLTQPLPLWKVETASEPLTHQRRSYVRTNWDEPIVFRFFKGDVDGKILDISEGGVRCVLPGMDEPRDSTFVVAFKLDGLPVEFKAELAWWSRISDDSVRIGASFLDLDQATRDKLRAHVYALQVENRRRGLSEP